jgi:hypothetical protein
MPRRRYLAPAVLLLAVPLSAQGPKETRSALESDPTGWVDLLAGDNVRMWRRVPIPPGGKLREASPWKIADGELLCDGVGLHEMYVYDRELADGVFHVEWRFKPVEGKKGYNSGVYVRNSADGKVWHQAQVGENVGYLFGKTQAGDELKSFNVKAVGPQRVKPVGEWNTYEVTCKGKKVELWVNGAVTCTWEDCPVPKGYAGLEAEGWVIEFKNVKWKELK